MNAIDEVPALVKEIYKIVVRLEELFPGRRFTPDGHLVGSRGEVLAAHRYNLKLTTASSEGHDAITEEGIRVQIKATQRNSISIRSKPDHLIVVKVTGEGTAVEEFNGPGGIAWEAAGIMQKNGQKLISLEKLRELMRNIPHEARLPSLRV
jgi:hypothetical protein